VLDEATLNVCETLQITYTKVSNGTVSIDSEITSICML
jgi:hypothetical protein